jgi:hypothetical protein
MSVDKHRPRVLVLPEDDANSRLANGFLREPALLTHRIQVLVPADGWMKVLECFESDHVDFDAHEERLTYAKNLVPARLIDRVFVLGVLKEPQDLNKTKLGSLETIGMALAKDCRDDTDSTWGHDLLKHNAGEIDRLRDSVRPFLFHL